MPAVAAAGAIAIAYFLTARLGLALLLAGSDVAVFWPASGVAAGILIVAGRPAVPAVLETGRSPHSGHQSPWRSTLRQ
jgi:integral membrane sensor domain MASE1